MPFFRTLILGLHILAAIVWIGGIFFETVVLIPALRRSVAESRTRAQLLLRIRGRFQVFRWEAVILVILTGIFNIINVGLARNFDFTNPYFQWLSIKITVVILIIAIQLYHQFRYIPIFEKYAADIAKNDSDGLSEIEAKFTTTAWIALIMAVVVVLLAVSLRFG
jgi:uncharacterized membrane protein